MLPRFTSQSFRHFTIQFSTSHSAAASGDDDIYEVEDIIVCENEADEEKSENDCYEDMKPPPNEFSTCINEEKGFSSLKMSAMKI